MTTLTLSAPAKINLFLDITGRRSDGYHTISGVMQSVSLGDTVTLTLTPVTEGETPRHTLTCTHPDLPTDGKNLALRAAKAFFETAGTGDTHLHIHIEKHIPAAAGMAGGSTDAAAVLKGLNELMGHPLTHGELCRVGLSLGADVPFCVTGGAQITEGVGEILTPCAPLPPCHLVVACAGEGVSTPAAYKKLDEMYGHFDGTAYLPKMDALSAQLEALKKGDLCEAGKNAYNIFESAVLPTHSKAGYIKNSLASSGAVFAMMSGSGPSVFGVFENEKDAQAAAEVLLSRDIPAWVCKPIGR
ncbi:MAG: 4-(cytidine 5'-diphospho)-2-C-methyl-D-erythritol kinase [Ruminococcaceae bacterium]|nr:4-(cytidine 5'-diphospho)-2-C-methyl-D-erythritol kinase [Oscillospiraceae bacterium]